MLLRKELLDSAYRSAQVCEQEMVVSTVSSGDLSADLCLRCCVSDTDYKNCDYDELQSSSRQCSRTYTTERQAAASTLVPAKVGSCAFQAVQLVNTTGDGHYGLLL
jgi:hypothetical protein